MVDIVLDQHILCAGTIIVHMPHQCGAAHRAYHAPHIVRVTQRALAALRAAHAARSMALAHGARRVSLARL